MTELQQKMIDHWIRWMPIHPEQVVHSIREYFDNCPWDKEVMKPILDEAWRELRRKNASNV